MRLADLALLILLQSLWAANPAMVKWCLREMNVDTLIFLRYGLASILLLALTTLRRQHHVIRRGDRRWLLVLGILVYLLSPLLSFNGIQLTQALDTAILVSLEPLATAILAYIVLSERLSRRQALSIAIAIPGVLLLSGVHQMSSATGTGALTARLLGNLLFVASLFCEGGHTVFGRWIAGKYPPLALSAYTFTIGFIAFALYAVSTGSGLHFDAITWRGWCGLLYLGGLCSAFGYTAWFYLLKRLPANTVAVSLYLQSVVGAFIGYIWLNERFSGTDWLGVLLIVGAVLLGVYTPRVRRRERKAHAA